MKSIRDIYKIGTGPSSSHTMGPEAAARLFMQENPDADRYQAILYGSLCRTGAGHGTDRAIRNAFAPVETEVVFCKENPDHAEKMKHPNTMDLLAFKDGAQTAFMRVYSIGGGDIEIEGRNTMKGQ